MLHVTAKSQCIFTLHVELSRLHLTVPPAYNAGRVTNQAALCREHIICHSHEQPPPIGDYGRLLLLGIGGRVCSRSRQQNSVFHQQCHRSAARRGCPAESWVSPPCHTSLCTMLWLQSSHLVCRLLCNSCNGRQQVCNSSCFQHSCSHQSVQSLSIWWVEAGGSGSKVKRELWVTVNL